MTSTDIHVFEHHAMATLFQARIAGQEKPYAAQTAQAAFALLDDLESRLSRFQQNSEISQIAGLEPGETLRLSEPVFACLDIALRMERAARGAFSISAITPHAGSDERRWTLLPREFSIRCENGSLSFDLGAIGKGFALDRMAQLLREWDCRSFLLVAGGSSVLAGDKPAGTPGWSCGFDDDFFCPLEQCSLSGSGLAVKGLHILDPRTGMPAQRRNRAWAIADTGAESDALSTAAMVLSEVEIGEVLAGNDRWLILLKGSNGWHQFGSRPMPKQMPSGTVDGN